MGAAFDLFTIGHSDATQDRLVELLRQVGVTAAFDVRSFAGSRRHPQFSAAALSARLAAEAVTYIGLGAVLGGRPRDAGCYRNGVADHELMAVHPAFHAGLDRVAADAGCFRLCLMGAGRDPLECHRGLLIGRRLAERGLRIGHIRHDATIESHAAAEERMLEPAASRSLNRRKGYRIPAW